MPRPVRLAAAAAMLIVALLQIQPARADTTAHDADIDRDGAVTILDVAIVVHAHDRRADVTHDGIVNMFDIMAVLAHFGERAIAPTATPTATLTTGAPASTASPTETPTRITLAAPTTTAAVPPSPTFTPTPTPTPTPTQLSATPTPTRTPTLTRALATPTPTSIAPAATVAPLSGTRDKFKQPFASTSIWNMPLGSNAIYKPISIGTGLTWSTIDEDVIVMSPNAPRRQLFINGNWTGRCPQTGYSGVDVPIPDTYTVPDTDGIWTPNFAGAFLMPDARTIVQTTATARCGAGVPVTAGYRAPNVDIYGDGIEGGHGGSGMSSVGGSIRLGELTGADPIRHVLKVNINCRRYCSSANGGYRWPAVRGDSYYAAYGILGQAISGLAMGSLLALPANLDINAMGLETAAAKKIAWTLQNYGAYAVDDTYDPGTWNVIGWDVERGVDEELTAATGVGLNSYSGPMYRDVVRILNSLAIVDNNGPSSVGGGGTPRQPLAPPIGN